jgi:hypothetical protein
LKKDITICIGTVGYPTFKKCHKRALEVMANDARIKGVVVIKDKYPTSAWLNEMRQHTETTWVLQLDEDMYIDNNCIDELLNLARISEASGVTVLNSSGLLYDLFLKTKIGSVKLWNTKTFKHGEFRDVKGSDRRFAADVSKFGFQNVAVSKVLGEHDSAPSKEIAYFKYKEYMAKIRRFDSLTEAKRFLRHFKKICNQHNTDISKYAYEGALAGMREPLENCTKNYLTNKNSNELSLVAKKLGF